MTKELTQVIVRELFEYRDGNLYWKVSRTGRKMGSLAGHNRRDGYRGVKMSGKNYLAHRLIFLYHHGFLPEFLDHIDRDKLNNSISNLREATNQQNQWNQKKTESINGKPTSSKYKGVCWDKRAKKWHAKISIDGITKWLGYFTSEIEAAKTYNKAAIEAFGDFAKTNKAFISNDIIHISK